MLPEMNHPFGSVEELLVQMGPSTPPLSPEEVEKHWTSKGRKEASVDGSKADKGEGDEMGKLLRELGVIVDKDASAAPITGGGAPGSAANQDAPREQGGASPISGQRSSGKFFSVVKNVFRASQSEKKGVCVRVRGRVSVSVSVCSRAFVSPLCTPKNRPSSLVLVGLHLQTLHLTNLRS